MGRMEEKLGGERWWVGGPLPNGRHGAGVLCSSLGGMGVSWQESGAKGKKMKESHTVEVPLCSWSCGGCRSK